MDESADVTVAAQILSCQYYESVFSVSFEKSYKLNLAFATIGLLA